MKGVTYSLTINKESKTWSLTIGTNSIIVVTDETKLVSRPTISEYFLSNGYGTPNTYSGHTTYCPCEYRLTGKEARSIFRELILNGFHP